ncbi:hypothetical protein DC498_00275 [Terrimonas sp.]|nr:hypothetical protein DC498_00275 [Terrimonas sp.]
MKEFNAFELTINDFNALNVFKQIISMFFSINDDDFRRIIETQQNLYLIQVRIIFLIGFVYLIT